MINFELYNKCKKRVARNNGLGATLVTGHREKYFIDTFILYLRVKSLYKLN